MRKKTGIVVSLLALVLIGLFYWQVLPMLSIATGYAAKKMCSCHFIAERSPASIQQDDLASVPLNWTKSNIDNDQKRVRTTLFGLAAQTTEYRPGLGCVLVLGEDDYQVQLDLPEQKTPPTGELWPQGEQTFVGKIKGIDYPKLEAAIAGIFDPTLEMDSIKTRAVVVVYKDTLIAEKYAKGIDKNTEILGWSMTKSITSALIGILVKDGKISISDDQLFPYWTDDRKNITVHDLLQMQSGLAFEEDYTGLSDATEMLFRSENVVERAARNPLDTAIGSKWYYSSGTSNILSGIIRSKFDSHEEYLKFPHQRLFGKIGMNSAVMEIDEAGNYIGSSFCYATPRDWAKFGLLFLKQGNWYGEQIVDTSWVEYVRQPAEHSNGAYGGHFWHNHGGTTFPDVPADLYSCNGFEGQFVYIIPSKDLVVVRMGLSKDEAYDANQFLKEIIAALPS